MYKRRHDCSVVLWCCNPEIAGLSSGFIRKDIQCKTISKSFVRACSLWRSLKKGAAERKFIRIVKCLLKIDKKPVQRCSRTGAICSSEGSQ